MLNLSGPFVYRPGHGPLKAKRRVRFPYGLPLDSGQALARDPERAAPRDQTVIFVRVHPYYNVQESRIFDKIFPML